MLFSAVVGGTWGRARSRSGKLVEGPLAGGGGSAMGPTVGVTLASMTAASRISRLEGKEKERGKGVWSEVRRKEKRCWGKSMKRKSGARMKSRCKDVDKWKCGELSKLLRGV